MDKIILILGDSTEETSRTIKTHYKETLDVINSFNTPSDFAEYYQKTPLRVDRIIVHESSFIRDRYNELQSFQDSLKKFYVTFDQCYFLVSNDKETKELLKFMLDDKQHEHTSKMRVFNHEVITPKMLINYALNKIPRRHFTDNETKYDEIKRIRKNSESTFKLDDDNNARDSELVVLDSNNVTTRQIRQKLSNLNSLSNVVKEETWENNKIIKDIFKIDQFMDIAKDTIRYDLDYTNFHLADRIKAFNDNIIIVTGERRSGKTTLAYALAKSASKGKKVLLIDFDTRNLGLSHLTESLNDNSTVMLLQQFKEDFQNTLRTMINASTRLNILISNTRTLKELGGIDPINFLSMIVSTCTKYYDNIIFDIPIENLHSVIPLMKKSEKLILTVPTNLNNIVSTVNLVKELDLVDDFKEKDLVYVPVDMFNGISGTTILTREQVDTLLTNVYSSPVKVFSTLRLHSFDLGDELYRALKTI